MADFMTSTHRAKWIFTPKDLKEKHKAANHRAKQALEKYGSTRVDVNIDGSFSYVEIPIDMQGDGEDQPRPKPLRIEEEQLLRAFYEFKIQDVCDAFKFPRKIQSFAGDSSHLLQKILSSMVCDGSSSKAHHAEENHVSAEELGKGIEQDHQSLGFDLIVYAPYRSLDGFINDIEEYSGAKDEQIEMLEKLHESAKAEVDRIMRTDAPLLFPPGQSKRGSKQLSLRSLTTCHETENEGKLALAALRRSNEGHGYFELDRYLRSIISRHHPTIGISDLIASLQAVDSLLNKLETPSSKDVKHIDRKLKSCLDPGSSSHEKSKKRRHRSKGSSNDH